jgi:uncharacterized protein involved in response to NO
MSCRPSRWRSEPFRIFFPLGVLLAWIGIGHWLLYAAGVTQSYSCVFHGLVQMQAFMMAFAVGFLLTAVPRRTQSAPPSMLELVAAVLALLTAAAAAVAERWRLVEAAYVMVFILLLRFAVPRFLGQRAGRRPPAAFVLIPIGVLHGLGGAVLIAAAMAPRTAAWMMGLGRLLVEQGVFLCFAVGVGGLVLPLMGGALPPPDLGSSRRETHKALAYAATGLLVFASFPLEQWGWVRGGPLLRAITVVLGFTLSGGAWRRPGKPGLHRQLVWLAVWLMPVGLLVSALWPDYRVPALHILFIGGFGLMAFAVATHVTLAHLHLERAALGRPPAVIVLGISFLLALLGRLAADVSDTYFDHLGWAAAIWLIGSGAWLAFLGPKLLRPST